MKKDSKILAIIPARGGSKGIKNKNIRTFVGKPLIAYTIEAAKKLNYLDRIIVSTDSLKIAKVARHYGAEVPFLRPKNLAGDKAKVVDAVIHLLDKLEQDERYKPDYILLLQTTSPLRTVKEINESIEKFMKHKKADGIVSIKPVEQRIYSIDKDGFLMPEVKKKFLSSSNRQELPATYVLDGAMIYLLKTEVFRKEKSFWLKKTIGYINPKWKTVDLDEPEDFVLGEIIFKNRKLIEKRIKKFK